MVAIGEHYRASGDGFRTDGKRHPAGIYRVVGTPGEVTLLRVADDDGSRRHTGQLVHVAESAIDAEFEPADDPDAGLRPVATVRNQLQGLYWSVRRFL